MQRDCCALKHTGGANKFISFSLILKEDDNGGNDDEDDHGNSDDGDIKNNNRGVFPRLPNTKPVPSTN